MIKVIDSIQYHVWSDALHARELARQTSSDFDRGAYVRWCIQTAWTAFENICTDALSAQGLGMRFKERFDEALDSAGIAKVNWGGGIWQKLLEVYSVRKEFTHVVPSISQTRLLTPLAEAEKAIAVLRDGIKAVADLVGHPHPVWVSDDGDPGWRGGRKGSGAHALVVNAGVSEDDPDAVRIAYVLGGKEYVTEIAPPGTPHSPILDRLLQSFNIPVELVRAYRGATLLEERPTRMRT